MCLSAYIGYLHWMTHWMTHQMTRQMIVLVRLIFHHFVFVIHVHMTHMCLLNWNESNLIMHWDRNVVINDLQHDVVRQ